MHDGVIRPVRRACALAAAAALALLAAPAGADEGAAALARIEGREQTLASQARATEALARQQARAAYRLARRRQLGFLPAPERRLEDARALDLALMALARSAAEARILGAELARAQQDRAALDAALARPAPAALAAEGRPPALLRPCRGPIVGGPGLHRDGTGVVLPQHAVQILARMNEPVRAPAAGTVHRVEALPQGGFGVVLDHGEGWVSVLEGLRDVSVTPGQRLEAGGFVGLVGRNLDGAPVLAIELWRGRRPVDARKLLRAE